MLSFIKGLFGVDAVVDTATKIIDKIAGTDWTAKEKADWILQYQSATKHQSPARRFIAMLVSLVWFVVVSAMALSYIIGNVLSSPEVLMIAKDMKSIMQDVLLEPFNLIIGFYFAMGIVNGIKK
ncbi:TMhelix containing protein [Vibrio phage LP.2]|nr:TMhelix containing protein [Vibrio phage LP.2]